MSTLSIVALTILVTAPLALVYASFAEWTLHKYVMHNKLWGFAYPFNAHAIVHHGEFRADESYHCQDPTKAHLITMAWWNKYVIIPIGVSPLVALGLFLGIYGWTALAISACSTLVAVSVVYYYTYEHMHKCYHLPRNWRRERWWVFQKLNGHHLLHHRNHKVNLNVVLPLADWILGTLVVRAKRPFRQPGFPVPSVQPLSA